MEGLEHPLWIVEAVNRLLGGPVASLLALMGFKVADPAHVIPDYIIMAVLVVIILSILFWLASRKLSLVPSKRQSILEMIIEFLRGLAEDSIGPEGRKYVPVVGSVGAFVLGCNLIGLVPGLMSPTSKLNVTVGCALVVFVYYHSQGIRAQGLKYFKQFMGPIPALAPLMVPIEIISHFSRPVSLSMRLFGNIFGEDLLILIMTSIIPYLLPLPFMALSIFTAVIQSFVFVLLSFIYIAGAVAHEEEQ